MAMKAPSLDKYRALLAIDKDDLDTQMSKNTEYYQQVGDEHAVLVSELATLKRELEEAEVEIGQELRREAADNQEKITEASLKERVQTHSRIKKLNRSIIDLKLEVDQWGVLLTSFNMRASMLKHQVPLALARRGHSIGYGLRSDLAKQNEEREGELRRRTFKERR